VIDQAEFAPGKLVDHGGGSYSLIYTTFPNFADVFAPKGLQGGGHTWHGMVVHLLEEYAPDALESLDFDPEGDMFIAQSDSLDALRAVAKVLKRLEDRAVVADLVTHVVLTEYD
jgi:Immunity protein 51